MYTDALGTDPVGMRMTIKTEKKYSLAVGDLKLPVWVEEERMNIGTTTPKFELPF